MRKFILVVCSCFLYGTNFGQELKIPYKKVTIAIDGHFEEKVWQGLPVHTNFYNYMPIDEGQAENQTEVKIFHNKEYIYVGVTYKDTTEKTQVSTLKRDVSIASSDSFIMVLDTQNQDQNGYLFAINSLGNQTDGLIERVNNGYNLNFSWNAVWTSKAIQKGKLKQYEIAIPLKALSYKKGNSTFGVQFYTRDIKNNTWTLYTNVKRNYPTFDLRFNKSLEVEALPEKATSRFAVIPSFTVNHQKEIGDNKTETTYKPSLDVQYNVTSSLKLDATINPDFSQIEVDQQVTNLTRFSVFFPERRNFFLENSDLFSNLGVNGVNPFYSRRIGADREVQFGIKLSGNVTPKTRLGVLNVQTASNDNLAAQNYGTLVAEQQISNNFTATGFIINRQETNNFSFGNDFNRVAGMNVNYKSDDKKWTGVANYGQSFNQGITKDNSFYHAGIWYNRRGFSWNTSFKQVNRNYITDVGFTPRLYNYDPINAKVVREGYSHFNGSVILTRFPKESKTINSQRYLLLENNSFWNENGTLTQMSWYYNHAIWFKDLSFVYTNLNYDYENLQYGFDVLQNGNFILPGIYRYGRAQVGYNTTPNKNIVAKIENQYGSYYSGTRYRGVLSLKYRLLPFANFETLYELNSIDLNELGNRTFHLARFTGEVFFNNRLNWTTYVQYNTQRNNFNVNSRLQWEYKPLSYMYLVVTDNFDKTIQRTNWGAAFKINYRFDF